VATTRAVNTAYRRNYPSKGIAMAKTDLGTKRICPETGKKFYDLNKDPIVSPFTGNEYPLSFFEGDVAKTPEPSKADLKKEEKDAVKEKTAAEDETEDDEDEDVPEIDAEETVSLEDAEDDDDDSDDDDVILGDDDDDIDLDEDDDDGVLLDDDEDGDDFGIDTEDDDDD
jgi:uncharacterized protein (TIGR02300 family)